ncbi:MAG TPA: hypothetical protein PLL33_10365, partial [Paracoccus sp. (in: a-proteobacteria)]|nr:hypothetical protein [Paracoccus sp. (in: a-proteobacteria)]
MQLPEDVQLVSRPALALALRGVAGNSTMAAALRLVAPLKVPVVLMPTPFPPEARLDAGAEGPVADAARRGDGAALLALARASLHAALRDIAAETGTDLRLLDQPADTVAQDIFTAARWTEGSVHLLTRRPGTPDDPLDDHANADYGARVLD